MDAVFKALADSSRRLLLDTLNERNGQTLRELSAGLDMTRQAVTKHLAVLEASGLVATTRRGREKLHYLNAAPINDIADRWINRYHRERARALADLKRTLEDNNMNDTEFVYVSYISTTPERLWQALTDPGFTFRYWGVGLESQWRVGAPVLVRSAPDAPSRDVGQVVLEADPYRRLSYSWNTHPLEYADEFGWTGEIERLAKVRDRDVASIRAEFADEQQSKVTFEIEPVNAAVKLTVVHDDLIPGGLIAESVSNGWPAVISALKSLLETDTAEQPTVAGASPAGHR